MASRKQKASAGAAVVGLVALGALAWWATRDDDAASAPEVGDGSKPPPTYTPEPSEPAPPPPPPVVVGAWCSTAPSEGAPPALSDDVEAWVLEDADTRLPWLWLALSLYVAGYRDTVPTTDELKDDHDRAPGPSAYSVPTQKGLDSLLVGRVVGEDKGRDLIDAFKAFRARDASKDRPCPVSVKPELGELLREWTEDLGIQADAGEI